MIIRISDLSADGLDVRDTIPLEALNQRLNDGQDTEIVFTSAPLVDVHVSKTADGAEVTGHVTTKYRQPCGRCLDTIDKELRVETNYILKPRSSSPEDDIDDVGLIYFDGEHIELEPIIQESLILSLSLYWCAPEDKQGKCTICHRTTETDTKEKPKGALQLGDLLKKAGLN